MEGMLPANDDPNETFFDETQAAAFLGLKRSTLESWRLNGKGPRFYRLGAGKRGRIRYKRADVIAWREAHAVETGGE